MSPAEKPIFLHLREMGNGKSPYGNGESPFPYGDSKHMAFPFTYGDHQMEMVSSKSPYGNGIQHIRLPISILGSPNGEPILF
jgi:hypothetical protein